MREARFEELLVRYEQLLRRRTEATETRPDLDVSDEGHTTLSYARLRALALADDDSAAPVVDALRFLHENAFHPEAEETGNWWHWEIGTPRILLDICVLLRKRIADADLKDYLAAVQWFCPDPDRRVKTGPWSPLTETGANRADKALIVALSGLLAGDADRVALARDGLSPLFEYAASGDGFHEDGSFIQHDTVAYTGAYGVVLLTSVAQILALLRGSPWEVADPGVSVVFDAVEKSFLPFLFEGRMMDTVRGRAIARQHSRDRDAGAATLDAIRLLTDSAPSSYAERWSALRRPEGFHVFGSMERVVHHRPRWSAALSLSSARIARYECGNGENLHGWYTGDGMLYIYDLYDPGHYTDEFWPTVDPYRLPGTTVDTRWREDVGRGSGRGTGAIMAPNQVAGGTLFEGGFGTAELDLYGEGSTLRAHKTWRFLDDCVVALGSGISADDGRRIETIVENRNLRADAGRRFVVDGVPQDPELGVEHRYRGARWAHLEGVGGYVFPGGADLMSLREERAGTWHAIDVGVGTGGDGAEVRRIFHTLWLDHDVSPTNAGYVYVLLPGAGEEGTARHAAQL
jgi:hyaluronate lyase